MKNKNIKIMVVTHKDSPMPEDKELYIPTLVGPNKSALNYEKYYRDDEGDSISSKNPNYCELTALYWAWKNLDVDYIGLVHYRRLLLNQSGKETLSRETLDDLLKENDIILPKKRNYFIESTYSHYQHNHNIDDLNLLIDIILEKDPSYKESIDKVMKSKKSHRFNMLVMSKEKLNDYCSWLFDCLEQLEDKVDISDYNPYQSRLFGFLSERMLDIWIEANQERYMEVPYRFTEKQSWLKKGGKFFINKFFHPSEVKV